jgi:4-hydroxy-3-polyprenylbenzoate decarboxylase
LSLRSLPPFPDLRAFLGHLERSDGLLRVREPVSVVHEMTEVHSRVLRAAGPAILFEQPRMSGGQISPIPVLVNLFGTAERTAMGLGVRFDEIERLGESLAWLRHPEAPGGLREALRRWPLLRAALATRAVAARSAPAQEVVHRGDAVDVTALPAQTCWPGEPAPLITWPLVVTSPPDDFSAARANVGVYRLQVLGRDRLIVRWLTNRGGARHHALWQARGQPMPIAIAIGTDPALMLTAAMPIPETVSELAFSGLLRGKSTRLARGVTIPLPVPADAEIVIEGFVHPDETAPEGPYGDHTGYYNAVEPFPVVRVTALTHRRAAIYMSTHTGRPPDEPSVIGEVFARLLVPLLRRQFPEIVDAHLPPEACSYRMAVVSIRKRYAGQARRLMLGLWSVLPQFTLTKMIVVVDPDIDVRSWPDVIWAISTRADPARDLVTLADTPIDYLDFASPKPGLGGKLGIDATNKIHPETEREWGRVLAMSPEIVQRVDALWHRLTGTRRQEAAE